MSTEPIAEKPDEDVEALIASAPELTEEQAARLRQLFRYGPPAEDKGTEAP